ncbi:MAG: RIP metalloprotease RseP [Dehalococcoidia bacterium]
MSRRRKRDVTPPTGPSGLQVLGSLVLVAVAIAAAMYFAKDATTAALLFIIILVGLVLAHEAGHFVTAKMFGVKVLEFGVGFPPRITGWKLGETEYTINWLPLGGFVRLLGEEDPSDPRSLAAQAAWKRFVVLFAGAGVNLVLPILLFAIAFTLPHDEAIGRAVVAEVIPNSPAEAAGLELGDVIYSIGGRDAKNVATASRLVRINMGHETDIRVKRGEEFLTVSVTPRWAFPSNQGPTGITIASQYPFTERVSLPPWESLPAGLRATVDTLILARNEVVGWVKGGSGPAVAGPVGIAETTGNVAREGGAPPLFELAALLSINLGVINLLPLPMLDGGRIFFLLIEVLRGGRRIAPEKEAIVHLVGFVLFVALAVVVTFADISRLVSGNSGF